MIARILRFAGSLKLTVVCLVLAAVLVFLGTIAQVHEGLYGAQARYFRSIFVYWSPPGADWRIPVFPGGYLIGAVMLINLVTSFADRLRVVRGRVGLLLTHLGLILLVLGQFATDLLSVESHMRLTEGEGRNYSESSSETELAIIETTRADVDTVHVIPEKHLAKQQEIPIEGLPFRVRVNRYYRNSALADRRGAMTNEPAAATQGFGPSVVIKPAPPVVKMDQRNLPAAVIELLTSKGSLGTWIVALVIDQPQQVALEGRTFTLQLRPTRYYKAHTITLLKFTHEKYPGTEIPKNFSSRVRVQNPEKGEEREVLIYMNNPLRYGGETYYQSGYDERDPRVSILQVVRNPSWLTPYFSCLLVGVGLSLQFLSHLVEFVRKRRPA